MRSGAGCAAGGALKATEEPALPAGPLAAVTGLPRASRHQGCRGSGRESVAQGIVLAHPNHAPPTAPRMSPATEQTAALPAMLSPGSCPHPSAAVDEEEQLRRYVWRSVLRAMLAIVVLIVVMAALGKYYSSELVAVATWIEETVGFVGLAAILVATDSVITPLPPDVLLVVIANTELAERWWLYVPALGAISSGAGMIAWYLSSRVGDTRIPRLLFGRFREQNQALVARYGAIAVALGSLTPIPYSVTCWTAGLFHMPFNRFAWVTLLRIPRFLGYYLVIAWSTHLFG